MFDRPVAQLAVGALLGSVLGLIGLEFGLVGALGAIVAVTALGLMLPSHAALSGGLLATGLTWLVVIGTSYLGCVSRGPDCDASEGFLAFLLLASVIFTVGLAVGLLAIARNRAERRSQRA